MTFTEMVFGDIKKAETPFDEVTAYMQAAWLICTATMLFPFWAPVALFVWAKRRFR